MAKNISKENETSQDIFPLRLRHLMRVFNVNQEKLAEICGGVSRQTISLYVQGLSNPDYKKLRAIAEYFRVSSDWLLGLSETMRVDADIKAVCELTGLSETAIVKLKEIPPENIPILNACLETSSFNTLLSSLLIVRKAAEQLQDAIAGNIISHDDAFGEYLNARFEEVEMRKMLMNYRFYRYSLEDDGIDVFLDDILGIEHTKLIRSAQEKLDCLNEKIMLLKDAENEQEINQELENKEV